MQSTAPVGGSFLDTFSGGLGFVQGMVDKVNSWKKDVEDKINDTIDTYVPEIARPLARRVYSSLPEIFLCGCAIMEVLTTPVLFIWYGRVSLLSLPAFVGMMQCGLSLSEMASAVRKWLYNQVLNEKETILIDGIKTAMKSYRDLCNSFRMALLVWCGLIGSAYTALGWLKSDTGSMLKAVVASILFQVIYNEEIQAQVFPNNNS
jgi:hypothetical protein